MANLSYIVSSFMGGKTERDNYLISNIGQEKKKSESKDDNLAEQIKAVFGVK